MSDRGRLELQTKEWLINQCVTYREVLDKTQATMNAAVDEVERLRAAAKMNDLAVESHYRVIQELKAELAAAFEEAAKWHEQEAKLWSSPSAERHAESAKHFRAKAKAKGSEVRGK